MNGNVTLETRRYLIQHDVHTSDIFSAIRNVPVKKVSDLSMNDVVQLDVGLYNGDRLKLTVVVVTGGATARQRDERAVRLRRVVKPRAEVVICGAETAAAFQLKRYTDTHIAQRK